MVKTAVPWPGRPVSPSDTGRPAGGRSTGREYPRHLRGSNKKDPWTFEHGHPLLHTRYCQRAIQCPHHKVLRVFRGSSWGTVEEGRREIGTRGDGIGGKTRTGARSAAATPPPFLSSFTQAAGQSSSHGRTPKALWFPWKPLVLGEDALLAPGPTGGPGHGSEQSWGDLSEGSPHLQGCRLEALLDRNRSSVPARAQLNFPGVTQAVLGKCSSWVTSLREERFPFSQVSGPLG